MCLLSYNPSTCCSEWCQFELKYCQTCVMERDDVMVLVALPAAGACSPRDLTAAMMALLRTTTYLEWQGDQAGEVCL